MFVSYRKLLMVCFLVFLLISTACEEMFEKTIDFDVAGMEARLSVTASLDADSGRFAICVFSVYPLAAYKDWRSLDEPVTPGGEIRLYEDGSCILTVHGPFDLSNRTRSNYGGVFAGYRYSVTGLPLKTGSMYRLEVDMEGYPMAWSTGVMPDPPNTGAVLDTTRRIYYSKPADPGDYYRYWWGPYPYGSDYSYPLDVNITGNNAKANNYYQLRIKTYVQPSCNQIDYVPKMELNDGLYPIGVVDFSMVEDQPEYWAGIYDYGNDTYDLYLMDHLILTDRNFAKGSVNLSLYLPAMLYRHYGWKTPSLNYDPDKHGPEVHISYRHDLLVRHISEEAYMHFRNMTLQTQGIDFFTEPVNIPGNIQNGYGCFSVSNTKRFNLLNLDRYHYPEWSDVYFEF